MRISGDLLAWSFTDMTWQPGPQERDRVVRFAGTEGSELWEFWVELEQGGRLCVDLAAACIAEEGSAAADLAALFPEWTSVTASYVTHLSWKL
jgi:hypothetical protein